MTRLPGGEQELERLAALALRPWLGVRGSCPPGRLRRTLARGGGARAGPAGRSPGGVSAGGGDGAGPERGEASGYGYPPPASVGADAAHNDAAAETGEKEGGPLGLCEQRWLADCCRPTRGSLNPHPAALPSARPRAGPGMGRRETAVRGPRPGRCQDARSRVRAAPPREGGRWRGGGGPGSRAPLRSAGPEPDSERARTRTHGRARGHGDAGHTRLRSRGTLGWVSSPALSVVRPARFPSGTPWRWPAPQAARGPCAAYGGGGSEARFDLDAPPHIRLASRIKRSAQPTTQEKTLSTAQLPAPNTFSLKNCFVMSCLTQTFGSLCLLRFCPQSWRFLPPPGSPERAFRCPSMTEDHPPPPRHDRGPPTRLAGQGTRPCGSLPPPPVPPWTSFSHPGLCPSLTAPHLTRPLTPGCGTQSWLFPLPVSCPR